MAVQGLFTLWQKNNKPDCAKARKGSLAGFAGIHGVRGPLGTNQLKRVVVSSTAGNNLYNLQPVTGEKLADTKL